LAKKAFVYDGSQWVDIAQSTADLSNYANMTTTPISGFRNAMINADFSINQRNLTSQTTDGGYGFDRWRMFASSGGTYSAQTFTPGAAPVSGYEGKNFARIVTTGQSGSGVYTSFEQRIEDVRTFAGQTVTVSFWAKAASGTPKVSIEFIQQFGSGGSGAVFVNASAVTLSTSWVRYSVSASIPSISGKTIGTDSYLTCVFWVSAGTTFAARTNSIGIQSNTFDFWGVQVEKGYIATPLEQRPIGTELALCQRYFQTSFNPGQVPAHNASGNGIVYHAGVSGGISGNLYTHFKFSPMRTFPIVSIFNGNNASATPSNGVLAGGLNTSASGIRVYTVGGAGTDSGNIGIDYIRTETVSLYAQGASGAATAGILAFGYSLNAEL